MKQGIFNSVQEVIGSSKLFHNQQGRRLLGFNATPLPGCLAPPSFARVWQPKGERASEGFCENQEDVWGTLSTEDRKTNTHNCERTPNPEFNTPVAERSSTYMSASSSRLLVSAEKEVPKLRSSSSLILNGNHSAAVACFNWFDGLTKQELAKLNYVKFFNIWSVYCCVLIPVQGKVFRAHSPTCPCLVLSVSSCPPSPQILS